MSSAAVVIGGVRVKRELLDFLFHVSMYAFKRQPVIFLLLHSFCQRKPLKKIKNVFLLQVLAVTSCNCCISIVFFSSSL